MRDSWCSRRFSRCISATTSVNEAGVPDATLLDLVGRCGGDHYVRAHGDALFTVPKPLGVMGMGVDALPRTSEPAVC